MPPNRLYQVLAGKRAMTADTALRLSQYFGMSADFWMNLQSAYELDLARQQNGKATAYSEAHRCRRATAGRLRRGRMKKENVGPSFNSCLRKEALYEETASVAVQRVLARRAMANYGSLIAIQWR